MTIGRIIRAAGRTLGGLLVIVGLLGLAQTAWPWIGAPLAADTTTTETGTAVHAIRIRDHGTDRPVGRLRTTPPPDPGPAPGEDEPIGELWIPALGDGWHKPIRQGVTRRVLDRYGAGHYPDTAMPGRPGNTSYAGHRVPADFGHLDRLRAGDRIIIETPAAWIVYAVNRTPYVVHMSRTEVIGPHAAGAARGLTLTTCDPMRFSFTPAVDRLIVHASYAGWVARTDGWPAELTHPATRIRTAAAAATRTIGRAARTQTAGSLAIAAGGLWATLDALTWIACRRRMRGPWTPGMDPMTLLWRIQAGPMPRDPDAPWPARLPGLAVRAALYALMWTAIVLAWWQWGAPWIQRAMPMFATGAPTIG
ncbi:sortase [Bifidobacterium margollesii]|uniref:Sortase n=1 Tax=Bifidobacterium margollesii TaxID=2020964 RepID=A0A2N5J714_9BIFI|nr:sortase [Bifidobacterium margollesii]PLS29977.1 sortase [Bifidobacterium margollesii]